MQTIFEKGVDKDRQGWEDGITNREMRNESVQLLHGPPSEEQASGRCEVSAADDLENMVLGHIAIATCRAMLADEWRNVAGATVPGTLSYYMVSRIESGEMDRDPSMLAMKRLLLERAGNVNSGSGFQKIDSLGDCPGPDYIRQVSDDGNSIAWVQIDSGNKPSPGELRHLAHSWAAQSARAAAGKARGMSWSIQKERSKSREKAKAQFLEALEKAMGR